MVNMPRERMRTHPAMAKQPPEASKEGANAKLQPLKQDAQQSRASVRPPILGAMRCGGSVATANFP